MKHTRFTFVLMAVVLCTACSSSTSKKTVVCTQQYWNGSVGVCLPAGWHVLSKESMQTLGIPQETIAAFQSDIPHAGQIDTVTITSEPLTEEMKMKDYSAASMLAVSALADYQLIDKQTITVDSEEVSLHVFSARPSPDQPSRRYYQVSGVSKKIGYTFTGSFPLSISETEAAEVKLILESATFIDPSTQTEE